MIIITILLALTCFFQTANAGKEAHGGGVALCPESRGSGKAEFIDLWMGRSERPGYGLPINDTSLPKEEEDPIQAQERFEQRALNRLKWLHLDFYSLVEMAIRHLKSIENLAVDGEIIIPGDMGNIHVPPNCRFAWVARYVEASAVSGRRLDYSRDLWEKMTPFSRAALMIHEAIYLIEREKSQTYDSFRTRQVVAALFSTLPMENVGYGVPAGTELCYHEPSDTPNLPTIYWRWPAGDIIRRQFLVIQGHHVLTRKYFDTPEYFDDGVDEFSTQTVSAFEKNDHILLRRDGVKGVDLIQIGPITAYAGTADFTVDIIEDRFFLERSCDSGMKNPGEYARWMKFLKEPPILIE